MRSCESRIFLVVIVRSQRRRGNLLQIALRPKDSSLHFLILGEQIFRIVQIGSDGLYLRYCPFETSQGCTKYAASQLPYFLILGEQIFRIVQIGSDGLYLRYCPFETSQGCAKYAA